MKTLPSQIDQVIKEIRNVKKFQLPELAVVKLTRIEKKLNRLASLRAEQVVNLSPGSHGFSLDWCQERK